MIYPIPTGTRDILPDEMESLLGLLEKLRTVFKQSGFKEVATPTAEYEDVVARGDRKLPGSSYRFSDEEGKTLVLRSDMTVPIARMVATRLAEVEPPFRFSSVGRVYRPVRPLRGQLRESIQAGVELIGPSGAQADAEVLSLLSNSLLAAGLSDFKLGVGDARLYRSLLRDLNVPDEQVLYELVTRDFVGLEREVKALKLKPADTELLIRLPQLRGGPEILDEIEATSDHKQFYAALSHLKDIYRELEKKNSADRVIFDLGLLRELGYYTGLIFEAYDPVLGLALGGGGRYDDLLGRFGRDLPAVGFDLSVERLHLAVGKNGVADGS